MHQQNRITQRFPGTDRMARAAVVLAQGVAFDAMFGLEDLLAALRFPRFLEETDGKEVGKQIVAVLLAHLWAFDSLVFHGGPHHWRVVPHDARENSRGEPAAHGTAQVGSGVAAFSLLAEARDFVGANAVTAQTILVS